MEINGKRVVITGANRGLGRALALACLRAGAREVVACARRPETIESIKAEANESAARLTAVALDLRDDKTIQQAARLGRADVLINNAGVACYGGALKGEIGAIIEEAEINYLGLLRVVRAFAPAMAAHGDGLIVNIGSVMGKVAAPVLGTYCATKAAMLSLSQALRGDLRDSGVRVITVLPSTLDTDMSRGFDGPKMNADEAAAEILEAIRLEENERPIGPAAREIIAALAADPPALEDAFSKYRA